MGVPSRRAERPAGVSPVRASHLGTIVRYADDLVILCRCEADAQQAYRWLQGRAQALKLVLHPDKTRIVDLHDGADGFDFVGFQCATNTEGGWHE